MDRRQWRNVSDARVHYDARDVVAGGGPIEAFFEIAARCNLHCTMCAINYDETYRPGGPRPPFFTPDLFARLRPIFPGLVRAYLFGLGEPTLNKHLPDYIAELKGGGTEVWFNTNATLIDDQRAEELARAGADRISVSIDGATKETYELVRRGAKFSAVLRGIRALVEAGRRHGRPLVNLSIVGMASNVGELPLLIELAAELGAYGVHVEPLYRPSDSPALLDYYERENLGAVDPQRVAALFDEATERAADLGVDFVSRFTGERQQFDYVARSQARHPEWLCSEPWASIWVTSAGEVRTCCTNGYAFGNVFETPIGEIWNGEPFRAFRAQHARRELATGCGDCIANGRMRNSAYFRTVERVTYRPMYDVLPASLDDSLVLETPNAGTTVTDPLVVSGRFDASLDLVDVELMINDVPVANFHDRAYVRGDAFVMSVPIPFVTEGAHVLWARRRGETNGWGHRQVYLWRPATTNGDVRVIDEAIVALPPQPSAPRVTIAQRRWRNVAWQTMQSSRGAMTVGRLDLRALPPGNYNAEVARWWRNLGVWALQKL